MGGRGGGVSGRWKPTTPCLATGAGNDREKGGLLLVGGEMRLGELGLGENRITNWG